MQESKGFLYRLAFGGTRQPAARKTKFVMIFVFMLKKLMQEGFVAVWRVENAHGCGPYAQSGKGNIHNLLHEVDDGIYVQHPLPQEDDGLRFLFNLRNHGDYFSGFESVEQYRRWFCGPEIGSVLAEHGFFLNKYLVPEKDVVAGNGQVMFLRDRAVLEESLSPLIGAGNRVGAKTSRIDAAP